MNSNGVWVELKTRLPLKMAHFAFAASDEAVYLAGGMTADGLLKEVFELRAKGEEVVIQTLPELPKPLAYAAGSLANGRFYVAGGQHDATVKVWPHRKSGRSIQPARRNGGVSRISRDRHLRRGDGLGRKKTLLYRRGSASMRPAQACNQKWCTGLRRRKEWESLADLPEATGGAVTPCPMVGENRIFVMGGYASGFAGERRDHPGFSTQTFLYDIGGNTWSNGPVLPHEKPTNKDATSDQGPAPMVAAPGAVWRGLFVAVGGEVRASVRTPAVIGYQLAAL